jgi:hypothetical protein
LIRHSESSQMTMATTNHDILWLIMTQCCPRCPRESNPSGITRHCQACKIYKAYMSSSQELGWQLSEAKLSTRLRIRPLQSQSQQHEPGPDSMQIDYTVSHLFLWFIFGQKGLIVSNHSPPSLQTTGKST